MELKVCKDEVELARLASRWCETHVKQGCRSTFVPAGRTPEQLYKLWREESPEYLTKLKLLQIDDVISPPQAGMFKRFFKDHLGQWGRQLVSIDSADSQADLAILGIGLNGHVGFHEPGLTVDLFSACVPLSEKTCQVLSLQAPQWGVTYGLGAFMRCRAILLMISGEAKREIFQRFIKSEGPFPALHLKSHQGLTVMVDKAAYGNVLV